MTAEEVRICEWCCSPIDGEDRRCPVVSDDGARGVRYWHPSQSDCPVGTITEEARS